MEYKSVRKHRSCIPRPLQISPVAADVEVDLGVVLRELEEAADSNTASRSGQDCAG